MRLAVIGLPQAGATTLFRALTGRSEQAHARPGEVHVAAVKVPDRRVDFLVKMAHPKKISYATIECFEVPGFFSARSGGVGADSAAINTVRDADALLKVLRDFDSEFAPNPRGTNDPLRDLRDINDELLTLDLAVIEKRIARLHKEIAKPTPEQERSRIELTALERCLAAVNEGTPLTAVKLNTEEEKLLRGYRFLSAKPCIHVVNVGESRIANPDALRGLPLENSISCCAKIEAEIEELSEADQKEFLADLGIGELARDRLIHMAYAVLGCITFLTFSSVEVKAWTLRRDGTAVEAAETIHSDLARGFIRAEVIAFDDLERLGSVREVRAHGKELVEGRDHVIHDGDIVNIRFNV